MRNIRNCDGNNIATGKSGCQLEMGKIRSIILVQHGQKIAWPSSASDLVAACHAVPGSRIFPIKDIVEYAKTGGEPQVSAVGYGGNGVTGLNARTDTFTIARYSEHLAASITKNMNKRYDAYYVDESNVVYGVNRDGDLYGFPVETVYCNATPHPTSSAQATMTVSICLENAREALEKFDYVECSYDVQDALVGLVSVDLVEVTSGKYKIVETIGGYDRTAELGSTGAKVDNFVNVTAVAYGSDDSGSPVLTITVQSGTTPALKGPNVIYSDLPGCEYNETITL